MSVDSITQYCRSGATDFECFLVQVVTLRRLFLAEAEVWQRGDRYRTFLG